MAVDRILVVAECFAGKPLPVTLELLSQARRVVGETGAVEAVIWGDAAAGPTVPASTTRADNNRARNDRLISAEPAVHVVLGLGVDLVVHEVDSPLVWVSLLVGQPQENRISAVAGRVRLAFADQLPNA